MVVDPARRYASPHIMLEATVIGSAEPAPRPLGIEILGGDLFEIGLTSLLYLAHFETLTGWLVVGTRGIVTLHRGQPGFTRAGSLRGVEALRELLFHRGGRFSLIRGAPELAEQPLDNTTAVMMDAYRLRDEWTRIAPLVLRLARPWHATGPLAATLARLDGRRTLADAARDSDGPLTPQIDPLVQALANGQLERAGSPPAPAPHPDTDDFYALQDRGRTLMRRGEHEAARATLERALALRPDDRVVQQNLRALAQRLRQP